MSSRRTVWQALAAAPRDDILEAVRLYTEWTGHKPCAAEARCMGVYIGCGASPSAAAARRIAYRLTLPIQSRAFRAPYSCELP
jgi:hypothetical protein